LEQTLPRAYGGRRWHQREKRIEPAEANAGTANRAIKRYGQIAGDILFVAEYYSMLCSFKHCENNALAIIVRTSPICPSKPQAVTSRQYFSSSLRRMICASGLIIGPAVSNSFRTACEFASNADAKQAFIPSSADTVLTRASKIIAKVNMRFMVHP
jgi:hypothetical protein